MYRAAQLAAALQVYQQKELQKTTISTNNVQILLEKTGLRSGAFDLMFPTMFSLHGLDINEALDEAVKSGDITATARAYAVAGINRAMEVFANRYPTITVEGFKNIEKKLQTFADLLYSSSGLPIEAIDKSIIASMKNILESLKKDFSKPYLVTYYSGSSTRLPSIKLLHNSFSNLRDIVNKKIKDEIAIELKNNRVTSSKLNDSNYLTTKIINWGHTKTADSFISGKLIASFMSLRNITINMSAEDRDAAFKLITEDFLQETGQEKVEIKLSTGDITKGDKEVLGLVLKSEFIQKVKVQNKRYNQEVLGQAEKRWSLVDAIGRKNLLKVFQVGTVQDLVIKLLNTRSSPAPIEKFSGVFKDIIAGKTPKSTASINTLLNSTKSRKENRKKIKLVSSSISPMRTDTIGIKRETAAGINLLSLQNIINSALATKIRQNMGEGNRSDVLNYRTGRFAQSAEVKRITQGREGMVSVYYDYMRYPYATFSTGGAQQYPKSRDPKLLISKSIREILQEQMITKMRAVLV